MKRFLSLIALDFSLLIIYTSENGWEIDHCFPSSKDGTNHTDNLQKKKRIKNWNVAGISQKIL